VKIWNATLGSVSTKTVTRPEAGALMAEHAGPCPTARG
jgi:hypothetical protein